MVRNRIGLGVAAALLVSGGGSAFAQTLQEALAAAYTNNPTLESQRAALRATDENVPQALSNWRPTVSLSSSYGRTLQNTAPDAAARPDIDINPFVNSLTVAQPLYRGGRTVAATQSAEAQVQAGRATLANTEQTVLQQVVAAYMDVLQNTAVLGLNRNNEQVLTRQLEAARDRFRVGEITRTDVSQAEARLSRARSDRSAAEGNLTSSRAIFQRAVGLAPERLSPPPPLTGLPPNETQAVEIGMNESPQLLAAVYTEVSSRYDIRAASGALLPTVTANGTAQRGIEQQQPNQNLNTLSLTATVTVPLYESGATYSAVRQRRQINSQRMIQVEEQRRAVREGVIRSWEALQTARSVITARQAQVDASRVALDGVTQEAQVGSRTTLDVLDAEQELLDASVGLVRAQRDEFVASYTLLQSVGRLTARTLGLPVQLYDPAAHYNEVRDKWWGTEGGLD
jgi:TolC family type I secretion outer membrane protein